jgi:crotonobetainyl-CoA:carnitine CoA-transferase CaiB-like acyl-CoA transferase
VSYDHLSSCSGSPWIEERIVLEGLRVVELAGETSAMAGKIMADLGADVVVIEPPGGHSTRSYGPFVDGHEGELECSLWWWYYNTSKRSAVVDLDSDAGRSQFSALVSTADVVLEGQPLGWLEAREIDHPQMRRDHPRLIWTSITPWGRRHEGPDFPMTDLTVLAGGGPVWNCGYDDHSLPPVRGGGNQAFHIASVYAVMSTMVAILSRDQTGVGQHVDVSIHSASNVTTESGSMDWLVARRTVQRQTGRHAMAVPTMEAQVLAADGRYVTTGFPPHDGGDYERLLGWMEDLGLADEFPDTVLLRLGVERGGVDPRSFGDNAEAVAIFGAGREGLVFLASRLSAYDFFVGAQQRDFQCGIVYAPDEAFTDHHFVERGFPVEVAHPELARTIAYPGAPFKSSNSDAWGIRRRPPLVGEHTSEVLSEADRQDRK